MRANAGVLTKCIAASCRHSDNTFQLLLSVNENNEKAVNKNESLRRILMPGDFYQIPSPASRYTGEIRWRIATSVLSDARVNSSV